MTISNLDTLSFAALEDLERSVAQQREQLAVEHKTVRAEIDRRLAVQRAQEKLAQMPAAERAIFAQAIASGEEFGKL